MSFIAKSPISAAEITSLPPVPAKGTRGIFAKEDGWYEIDDKGNVKKLGSDSGEGKDGKSAYEIALDNGFEGTEEEWLVSLKGKDGYTPRRGVDYWTDADKAEIKAYVEDAILGGEW